MAKDEGGDFTTVRLAWHWWHGWRKKLLDEFSQMRGLPARILAPLPNGRNLRTLSIPFQNKPDNPSLSNKVINQLTILDSIPMRSR